MLNLADRAGNGQQQCSTGSQVRCNVRIAAGMSNIKFRVCVTITQSNAASGTPEPVARSATKVVFGTPALTFRMSERVTLPAPNHAYIRRRQFPARGPLRPMCLRRETWQCNSGRSAVHGRSHFATYGLQAAQFSKPDRVERRHLRRDPKLRFSARGMCALQRRRVVRRAARQLPELFPVITGHGA